MGLLQTFKNAVAPSPTEPNRPSAKTTNPFAAKSPAANPQTVVPAPGVAPDSAPVSGPSRSPEPVGVPPVPKRILYVDDNTNRLQHTQRTLQCLRDDWQLVLTPEGIRALELLDQTPFDAIVTEMQMEQGTGVELLNKVVRRYPRTLRLIRCTPEEVELTKSCLGTPPHIVPRECDAATFQAILARAFQLDAWMSDAAVKKLYAQLTQLPTLPTLYNQVISELQSPKGSLDFVARLISKDPVMTAKMLQMANSALFACPRQITETVEAVMLLGAERVKSLILLSQVFTQFDKAKCPGLQLEQLWMHCMAVGAQSMAIAMDETRDARLAEMAFTAGLLHDVGMLLLAGNLPTPYSSVLSQAAKRQIAVRDVELEAFGASHAEVGACLLGVWGLPLPILEAIAWHHAPRTSQDRSFSLLTAVHVANALDYEKKASAAVPPPCRVDVQYLMDLGLLGRLNRWREICGCPPSNPALGSDL